MKKLQLGTLALIGSAILAAAPIANAQVSMPNGWYLEGNGGVSSLNSANYGNGTSTANNNSWGGNVNFGYKYSPYFGGEIGYTKYSNVKLENSSNDQVGTVKQYSYDAALKGMIPIVDSGFEVFAKLGAAHINANVSSSTPGVSSGNHSATGAYIGAGVAYAFMPNAPVNIQWQRAVGNNTTGYADFYSLGIAFIFC